MTNQDRKKKQEEMYGLIGQWQQSGLPKQEFCKRHDIAFHVFYYYYNKYQGKPKKRKKTKAQGFLPIKVASAHAVFPPVEIVYPNGVSIKCPPSIKSSQLKELINIF